MCYTSMCKHESYMGECRATSAQRCVDCPMSDDFEDGDAPEEEDDV